MRLENYIIEEEKGLAHFIPKIQRECKPFLKDIKNAAGTLYRIDAKGRGKPVWKKTIRKHRIPSDTDPDISEGIDELFQKKFGWKPRSEGLFCWPRPFSEGGSMWMVFPAGNYKYVWSNQIYDMFPTISEIMDNITADEWEEVEYDEIIRQTIQVFEKYYLPSYNDKKIKMSIKYQNEIMIGADYAYLIKPELIEPVNEILGLNWQNAKFMGRKI